MRNENGRIFETSRRTSDATHDVHIVVVKISKSCSFIKKTQTHTDTDTDPVIYSETMANKPYVIRKLDFVEKRKRARTSTLEHFKTGFPECKKSAT